MKVRTRNSVYQIVGKGTFFEATKLENEGLKGEVRLDSVYVGTRLSLAVGEPMLLKGVEGRGLRTSTVVAIE